MTLKAEYDKLVADLGLEEPFDLDSLKAKLYELQKAYV